MRPNWHGCAIAVESIYALFYWSCFSIRYVKNDLCHNVNNPLSDDVESSGIRASTRIWCCTHSTTDTSCWRRILLLMNVCCWRSFHPFGELTCLITKISYRSIQRQWKTPLRFFYSFNLRSRTRFPFYSLCECLQASVLGLEYNDAYHE